MVEYEYLTPDTVRLSLSETVSEAELADFAGALSAGLGPDPVATVNLLIDVGGLADLAPGPVSGDLSPERLYAPLLPRIRRLAAIGEPGWVQMAVRTAAAVLPALEARAFGPDQREAARDYVLGQLIETGDGAGPSLRLLGSGHPDLIAYEIDGVLNQDDAERVMTLLERALERDRPVSLLVKIKRYGGFDPTMLLSGPLWTMKLSAIRHLHRYAVVGAEPWMQSMAKFTNPLTMLNMKLFTNDAETEAWDWVRQGLGSSRPAE